FVESHDAQLLSTYFPADVQSANPTMVNPTTAGCGGTMLGTKVLRLDWTESDATVKTVFSASYWFDGSSSGSTLRRHFCSNTGSLSTPEGTILAAATATPRVVAHDLADPAVQPATAVNVDPAKAQIDLTLYSYRTEREVREGI